MMPFARQRQWRAQSQQHALLEYGLLKQLRPDGVFIVPTPEDFCLWSGVMFTRKGPYSPAVFRFQVALPPRYPDVPLMIIFSSDIFHPLVTPLTTYTYTTGSSASETVSAGDEERLLPGSFSLRHGFPKWFSKDEDLERRVERSRAISDLGSSISTGADAGASALTNRRPLSFHITPPKSDGTSENDEFPSIIEVLYYLKRSFEDETLLDNLPFDYAANSGAWHAWQAHRKKARSTDASGAKADAKKEQKALSRRSWNWDGVWADRVKKGLLSTLSESTLYGNADGDALIHFLDIDNDAFTEMKKRIEDT